MTNCRVSLSIFGLLNKDDGSGKDTGHSPPDGVTTPTLEWLYSVLLWKVVQWSEESERRRGGRETSSSSRQHESLVPLASYSSLYRHLRDKYGPPLIQVNLHIIIIIRAHVNTSFFCMP